ncbi:MAG: hypothetical protein MUP92_02255, partial [Actinobacteria bacterium]|nr:hypothetical protein [Actinomycetota bacterium]
TDRWVKLRERFSGLQTFLANAWFWNAAYEKTIVPAGKGLASFFAFGLDKGLIDGVVNGVGMATRGIAAGGRRIQTGYVRTYAAAFLLGVAVVLAVLVVRS